MDRYGPKLGLPIAYSGHNAFAEWGPPPDGPGAVIVVGLDPTQLHAAFEGCTLAARISNSPGIDNDERGATIDLCSRTRRPWSLLWSRLRHLG